MVLLPVSEAKAVEPHCTGKREVLSAPGFLGWSLKACVCGIS